MINERLKEVRKALKFDLEKVAEDLNITSRALRSYERGERKPQPEYLDYLHKTFHINLNWIYSGEGEMFKNDTSSKIDEHTENKKINFFDKARNFFKLKEDISFEEFKEAMDERVVSQFKLPVFGEVEASAGQGCFVDSEQVTDRLLIDSAILKQIGANADSSGFIKVRGDSMTPNVNDGDLALVDTNKKDIVSNKIYVIRVENDLYLKRIKKTPNTLVAISDNAEYDPFIVSKDAEICGQVLWVSRGLN